MKRVLVTGGAGFIGSHVVKWLQARDLEPVILDHRARKRDDGVEVYFGDIRDETAVMEAVGHVDGVIHLAGVLGTQETVRNPRPAATTNILGGINVLEAVAHYGLPASLIAVGNHFELSPYAITKTAAERLALMYNRNRGTRVAVVRAMNAYGPGQVPSEPYGPSKVRKIIPAFVCRALADVPIEIYGDGSQVMDMVRVEDVADALVRALVIEHGVYGSVFEVGTGQRTTVREIAAAVLRTCGKPASAVTFAPMRPGETPGSVVVANPDTLAPLYGGRTPTLPGIDDGLVATVLWLRDWRAAA